MDSSRVEQYHQESPSSPARRSQVVVVTGQAGRKLVYTPRGWGGTARALISAPVSASGPPRGTQKPGVWRNAGASAHSAWAPPPPLTPSTSSTSVCTRTSLQLGISRALKPSGSFPSYWQRWNEPRTAQGASANHPQQGAGRLRPTNWRHTRGKLLRAATSSSASSQQPRGPLQPWTRKMRRWRATWGDALTQLALVTPACTRFTTRGVGSVPEHPWPYLLRTLQR